MAGHATASCLTGEVVQGNLRFTIAARDDEADVRRLLREIPIGGRYQITLERQPDAFAPGAGRTRSEHIIIARDRRTGCAAGLCERVVRDAFVDGSIRQLPYIGALRIAPSHRHKIAVLRGGFEALRLLTVRPGELPFALTSITSDNSPARRVLTALLPGLPLYHPAGDFSTLALRPKFRSANAAIQCATSSDFAELSEFLNRVNARAQFAPVWSEAALRGLQWHGLLPEHFLFVRQGKRISGCMAVWDQRRFRQVVVRQYPKPIGALRPLLNLATPLAGLPRLPAIGTPINQCVLSHVAFEDEDQATLLALLDGALDRAKRRKFDAALIGFATERPWRAAIQQYHRAIEYQTSLYLTHWPDATAFVASLQSRTPHPELGLL
ncbi:MAG: hypothetical protein ABL893_06960 [Hyphomicrobium sp.]